MNLQNIAPTPTPTVTQSGDGVRRREHQKIEEKEDELKKIWRDDEEVLLSSIIAWLSRKE